MRVDFAQFVALLSSAAVGIAVYRLMSRSGNREPSADWEAWRTILTILFFPLLYLYIAIRDAHEIEGFFDD